MRIDTLPNNNRQTQGAQRREWLRAHSPQHLEHCRALIREALNARDAAASRSMVVLGAGACTEVPLGELARAADDVALVDLDVAAMRQAREALPSPSLRRRVRLLRADITGGISANLNRLLAKQPWKQLAAQGARAFFDAAALCLDQCAIPDTPKLDGIGQGEFGLAISALVMTQLFSYPLLDILDLAQRVDPRLPGEQEHHRGYQEASQAFRTRVIRAHLHLLRGPLDRGGVAVLLTDIRGFAFTVHGTDHDAAHRRAIPLVPRAFFDLVRETFTIRAEQQWEWLSDLPDGERPGRGYEVAGYVLE